MEKKAEMGMGTLIIFIAMILVAAVAAGVLISTTGSLQNKALATGKATTYQVGTSLEALEIYGEDGSTNNSLDFFFESMRLSSGSENLKFADVLLTFSLSNQSADYTYSSSVDCDSESSLWGAGTTYGVKYSINASTGHLDGYLVKGDVVKLCLLSPRVVEEGEDLKIALVPRVGSPLVIEARLPDLIVDKRIAIYP